MAPPDPPPGEPGAGGLAPRPMARLSENLELYTDQDTPMLLNADPLLHRPPVKVLSTTYTGSPRCCDSARTAAPPRSGPLGSHRLSRKTVSTIFSRPPRTKIAPPPPPSYASSVLLPSANVRCWTTSRGLAWSSQCEVVHVCFGSQVSW